MTNSDSESEAAEPCGLKPVTRGTTHLLFEEIWVVLGPVVQISDSTDPVGSLQQAQFLFLLVVQGVQVSWPIQQVVWEVNTPSVHACFHAINTIIRRPVCLNFQTVTRFLTREEQELTSSFVCSCCWLKIGAARLFARIWPIGLWILSIWDLMQTDKHALQFAVFYFAPWGMRFIHMVEWNGRSPTEWRSLLAD